MKKNGLLILITILIAFAIILWATSLVGTVLGKTGELIALIAVAAVLLVGFIKSKEDK
ncbi:MAG: hypothetical protein HFE73_06870 [Firmicutes bacterium]|nr:hypothetical protein [Bacillota bacterium]